MDVKEWGAFSYAPLILYKEIFIKSNNFSKLNCFMSIKNKKDLNKKFNIFDRNFFLNDFLKLNSKNKE